MSKLLHAGVRRYLKSAVTWISILVTVILGVHGGRLAMVHGVIDGLYLFEFFVFVFFISFSIGREFDENVIRNKVICGHGKGSIFFSELLLAELFASVLLIIYGVCFFGLNYYVIFGRSVPPSYLITMFAGFYLCSIFIAAIVTVVAVLVPKRAIILVVSSILIAGIILLPDYLKNNLEQEQYLETSHYKTEEVWQNGEIVGYINKPIESEIEENPRYVNNNTVRNAIETAYDINPVTSLYKNGEIMANAFGEIPSHYFTDADSKVEVKKEDMKFLKDSIFYTLAETVAVIALGYLLFRKKELK